MKIRHFVYGKFSSSLPDFGVRVSDTDSFTNKDNNEFNEIARYFQNHFRSIFYNNPFPVANPDVIAKVKDTYVYARFYPPFKDQRGANATVECLFHAFVFSQKDIELINFCPWRLKRNFIKEFNHSEIIGHDDKSWLKADECSSSEYNTIIDIETDTSSLKKSIDKIYNEHTPYYVIINKDPEAVLTRLEIPLRLSIFSSGVLLNGNISLLPGIYSRKIHFVFLQEIPATTIPESFINLSTQELPLLKAEEAQPEIPKQVIKIIDDKPGVPVEEVTPLIEINTNPVKAPELIEAKYENGHIYITWGNNNDIKINVVIQRKIGNQQFSELTHNIVPEANSSNTFTDTAVKNGEEYIYRLQHYSAGTNPDTNNYVETGSIRTSPLPISANTLECVFDKESLYNLRVHLRWQQPKNSFPVAYNIYRTRLSDLKRVAIVKNLFTLTFTDNDNLELTPYSYSIEVTEPKTGLVSQPVQATCDPLGAEEPVIKKILNPPSKLGISKGDFGIKLKWYNSNREDLYVSLKRKEVNSIDFYSISNSIQTAAFFEGAYLDNNITNDEQYIYEISFFNSDDGKSIASFIETQSIQPGAPLRKNTHKEKKSWISKGRYIIAGTVLLLVFGVYYFFFKPGSDRNVAQVSYDSNHVKTIEKILQFAEHKKWDSIISNFKNIDTSKIQDNEKRKKLILAKKEAEDHLFKPDRISYDSTHAAIIRSLLKAQSDHNCEYFNNNLFKVDPELIINSTIKTKLKSGCTPPLSPEKKYEEIHADEINKIIEFKKKGDCKSVLIYFKKISLPQIKNTTIKRQLDDIKTSCPQTDQLSDELGDIKKKE